MVVDDALERAQRAIGPDQALVEIGGIALEWTVTDQLCMDQQGRYGEESGASAPVVRRGDLRDNWIRGIVSLERAERPCKHRPVRNPAADDGLSTEGWRTDAA